ncbi:MAG: hypothetical protein IJ169_00505 [Paludibacteraceae bacterium]|nr:hypothetical protein [Paludibacteraceae bacterium]
MKVKYHLILLLPLLVGCNGYDMRYVDYYHTSVVKFIEPEYANYICGTTNGGNGTIKFWSGYYEGHYALDKDIAGKSPYIDLGDGYLLIDWKWDYLPLGDVIIKKPWSEMSSTKQVWSMDSVETIPGPYLAEVYKIYFYDIDNYLNALKFQKNSEEEQTPVENTGFRAYDYSWMHQPKKEDLNNEELEKYERNKTMADSIQSEYVEKLRGIIAKGNFPFRFKLGGLWFD